MDVNKKRAKKRNRPLNSREKLFVKKYIELGSARKAGVAAYSDTMKRTSALAYGPMKLRKPAIRDVIEKYIRDEEVASVLRDQLSATKMEKNYETGDTMQVPDNQARLKAVDISLKVKGAYPTPGQFTAEKQINFIVTKMEDGDKTD